MLDVLRVTDFSSPIFEGVGGALIARNFETYFALKLMLKDTNLIAHFAERLNVPIPASGGHSGNYQGCGESWLGRGERLGPH